MQRQRFGWVKGGVMVAVLMAGAVCWAGTKGSFNFTLANIDKNGNISTAAGTVKFNYVLDSKKNLVGQASGKVKNLSKLDAAFANVGHFAAPFTDLGDIYTVDDVGNALFVAAGKKS